jgi:hypothetical protein
VKDQVRKNATRTHYSVSPSTQHQLVTRDTYRTFGRINLIPTPSIILGTKPTMKVFAQSIAIPFLLLALHSTKRLPVASALCPPGIASVVAGSVAGAIGVGVAFPLDTLKTKSQVMSQKQRDDARSAKSSVATSAEDSAVIVPEGSGRSLGMLQVISLVWTTKGIAGFFGGVKGMMIGQAVLKAIAFSANANALALLVKHTDLPTIVPLLLAACFAGFITSFVAAPIERIKVMMQASSGIYKNEIECCQAILRTEGWKGFMGRGLGATLAREIPSYGIYFCFYGFVIKSSIASLLGPAAPLVFGALAGMACWLPVYPVDVVKVSIS